VGQDEKIQYANRVSPGLQMEDVIGTSVFDYIVSEYHETARNAMARVFENRSTETFENKVAVPPGNESSFTNRLSPIIIDNEVVAVAYISTDITARVLVEEALKKSEERFRNMAETAQAAILIVSGTTIQYANPAGEGLLGRSLEELQTIDFWEVAHPDDREALVEHFDGPDSPGQLSAPYVYRVMKPDGDVRWAEASATMTSFQGENAGAVILLDVTERVLAEEELRKSEIRFRKMAETSQAGIFIVSGTRISYANPAGETLLGRNLEELKSMEYWEAAHTDDREGLIEHFDGSSASAQELAVPYTYRVVKPNGEERWVEASGAITSFEGADSVVVILLDVTERVRAEEAAQVSREELEGKVERQMLRKNPYTLTFRELTVLHHVAEGKADKQIAKELGISPLTAQNHVRHILSKMDASSRTDASVRAVREGLVD
jgi:PAS domain S-box-containing protein